MPPKNIKRPTLQDLADHLGLTKMTISRYLRDPNLVAAHTQQRIAKAVEDFGYIPNRVPEILTRGKSRAIGVLVPSLTNSVFAEVIRGIEEVTDLAEYQPIIAHYGYSQEKEEQRIEALLSFHIDGLILSETQHSPRSLKMLEVANIPVIEIMDTSRFGLQQTVGFNNIHASEAMTETLITRGKKQIIYFSARMDNRTKLKIKGYEKAMNAYGLTPQILSTNESSSFSLGALQLRQALEKFPEMDGIFCTNDDLAVGALFECQRLGIEVPQQIAIAGFHGHNVGQSMTPQLASVITPRFEIGKTAAELLIARLQGEEDNRPVINLGYDIHLGQSV